MTCRVCMLVIAFAVPFGATSGGVARANDSPQQSFDARPLPALDQAPPDGAFLGVHEGTALLAHAGGVFALREGANQWEAVGRLREARANGAAASIAQGVVLIGGKTPAGPSAKVTLLALHGSELRQRALPDLPRPLERPAATALGGKIYVAAADAPEWWTLDPAAASPAWQELPVWPGGKAIDAPALVGLQNDLYLFGSSEGKPVAYVHQPRGGWAQRTPPSQWPADAADATLPFGHSHIFLFGAADGRVVPTYHTITDTWLALPLPMDKIERIHLAAARGGQSILITGDRALAVTPQPVKTNYGWLDHAVVAIYLLAMVAMGWYFAGREKNTEDYFRGGKRVPWWATGMSLFATGASAISLMSMPGKAYAGNWAYFTISIFSLLALPVSIFFLAPLVRRLNIATANEYLERRFGVTARLFASTVYCFTQVCGRMAPVMLLPSIALSAITGIDITVSILIMGVITTIYTFLGGLEAVIWTDTVQGLIMCAAVAGCLVLALVKLSMGPAEIWSATMTANKLHMFDWSLDIAYPVAWVFLISTVVGTLSGIGDQNFVQRVQCTPTLLDAKKAIATQLAVAVPINILLFALGTALWLFYRGHPAQLNPTMETDGIYPFFVAQQLPPGLSGLVVAALLAATMSTISSSICAVSDLGVNDFYRRFVRGADDRSSFVLGRILMGVVGALGTGFAILLGQLGAASIWDLALLVTGLISNGIIGLFWVGLLTRRAHERGALSGVVLGMVSVVLLERYTAVHFLWYQAIGATVTIITGYLLSLVLPGRVRNVEGLTIFALPPDGGASDGKRPTVPAVAS